MNTKKQQRENIKEGSFLKIDLGNGLFAYCRALRSPLFAFYQVATDQDLRPEKIITLPIMFKIFVKDSAFKSGRWKVNGYLPLEDSLKESPSFYIFNPITGKIFLYKEGKKIPATRNHIVGLECAAVWDPEHVEERIRDSLEGKRNKWVESLKVPDEGD